MSQGGFQINPEDFGPAADKMDAAGADLAQQWVSLREQSLSVQFGSYDLVGPLIQASLQGAVAVADECFGSSGESLADYGVGLRSIGRVYASAEADNTQMLDQG